jgi:hypothetical protein
MKARALIDGASFGPDALKVMGRAFDEAWVSIAGNFSAEQTAAARLRSPMSCCPLPTRTVATSKH